MAAALAAVGAICGGAAAGVATVWRRLGPNALPAATSNASLEFTSLVVTAAGEGSDDDVNAVDSPRAVRNRGDSAPAAAERIPAAPTLDDAVLLAYRLRRPLLVFAHSEAHPASRALLAELQAAPSDVLELLETRFVTFVASAFDRHASPRPEWLAVCSCFPALAVYTVGRDANARGTAGSAAASGVNSSSIRIGATLEGACTAGSVRKFLQLAVLRLAS